VGRTPRDGDREGRAERESEIETQRGARERARERLGFDLVGADALHTSYLDQGQCLSCPDNSVSDGGSAALSECTCDTGFTGNPVQSETCEADSVTCSADQFRADETGY